MHASLPIITIATSTSQLSSSVLLPCQLPSVTIHLVSPHFAECLASVFFFFFFLIIRRPPRSPLFPYPTLFRSAADQRRPGQPRPAAPPGPLLPPSRRRGEGARGVQAARRGRPERRAA